MGHVPAGPAPRKSSALRGLGRAEQRMLPLSLGDSPAAQFLPRPGWFRTPHSLAMPH